MQKRAECACARVEPWPGAFRCMQVFGLNLRTAASCLYLNAVYLNAQGYAPPSSRFEPGSSHERKGEARDVGVHWMRAATIEDAVELDFG